MNQKKLIVLSGGLDSTVLLHQLVDDYGAENVTALSFDYQQNFKLNFEPKKIMFQNNRVELKCAKWQTNLLNVKHIVISVGYMNDILNIMQTEEKYNGTIINKKANTALPFRNLMLMSIAYSVAEINEISEIYCGFQKQDKHTYWDTTDKFIRSINNIANLNNYKVVLKAPFYQLSKYDEIVIGKKLGVEFRMTWSCYNPIGKLDNLQTCKECPACKDRIENFNKWNKIYQPYWKEGQKYNE